MHGSQQINYLENVLCSFKSKIKRMQIEPEADLYSYTQLDRPMNLCHEAFGVHLRI